MTSFLNSAFTSFGKAVLLAIFFVSFFGGACLGGDDSTGTVDTTEVDQAAKEAAEKLKAEQEAANKRAEEARIAAAAAKAAGDAKKAAEEEEKQRKAEAEAENLKQAILAASRAKQKAVQAWNSLKNTMDTLSPTHIEKSIFGKWSGTVYSEMSNAVKFLKATGQSPTATIAFNKAEQAALAANKAEVAARDAQTFATGFKSGFTFDENQKGTIPQTSQTPDRSLVKPVCQAAIDALLQPLKSKPDVKTHTILCPPAPAGETAPALHPDHTVSVTYHCSCSYEINGVSFYKK